MISELKDCRLCEDRKPGCYLTCTEHYLKYKEKYLKNKLTKEEAEKALERSEVNNG